MTHRSAAKLAIVALVLGEPPLLIDRERTLGVLAHNYPDVRWQVQSAIDAELTDDGESDLAVAGRRGDAFAVAVILAPIGPQSRMLRMMWLRDGAEASRDCARGKATVLTAEAPTLPTDLWGCLNQQGSDEFCAKVRLQEAWLREAAARGMRGLRVSGESGCTEVHLYWNPEAKQFDQWQAE